MADERAATWAMLALMALLGTLASFRHPPAIPPERMPATAAKPWMADCLPGVGPRTRERAALDIRAGKLDDLPVNARATARELFAW
jgi:hypothetical protein